MHTSYIGLHKVIAPDVPHLRITDGMRLSERIQDEGLIQAVMDGKAKIAVLFPDHFVQYASGVKGPKIYAEFFVGLFEEVFEKIRDENFPALKNQANRDKIRKVGSDVLDLSNLADELFHTPWVTYDPFETFLEGRICIGIQHANGGHTLIESRHGGIPSLQGNRKNVYALASHAAHKYYKAMDGMFFGNLRLRDSFLSGPRIPQTPPICDGGGKGLRVV